MAFFPFCNRTLTSGTAVNFSFLICTIHEAKELHNFLKVINISVLLELFIKAGAFQGHC